MIGVFDSGIGGLTVVRDIRRKNPGERIVYVGDVARMPYGNKSAATVTEYAREITRYLVRRGARMVVIACNTASAVAANALRKEFKVPILDVITPAVRAARMTGAKRIAVLGTRGTIASGAYQSSLRAQETRLLRRSDRIVGPPRNDIMVFPLACPMFVPIVEEGLVGTKEGEAIIRRTLAPLKKKKIDATILGCTHYPLLSASIRRALPGVRLITSAAVADDVRAFVEVSPRPSRRNLDSKLEILVTDRTPHFERFARQIIGPVRLRILPIESLDR